jgi:phosphate transport system permease protein
MSRAISADAGSRRRAFRRRQRLLEGLVERLLLLSALVAVGVTVAIVGVLLVESAPFFAQVPLSEFLGSTQWSPLFEQPRFGIWALLAGTLTTSLVAMAVAVPLGILLAIHLSEFASVGLRERVKPVLELLAGMPTVVFGYFALLFVTPLLQQFIPGLPGFNMLSAGLVLGVMVVPYVSSVSEDALRAVPMELREAAYALGAGRMRTALTVVLPAAVSGVVAACILAASRAVGETMVVAIAAGQQPNFSFDPTESAATVTAYIVQVAMGDLPQGSIGYQSIFAAGLALFMMTLAFNLVGQWIRLRFREPY